MWYQVVLSINNLHVHIHTYLNDVTNRIQLKLAVYLIYKCIVQEAETVHLTGAP